ncbi:MAG TPA: serine hydrolase domain-containing protein [Novosphingobium sp.]|nr:serine hydrolase domain-containing protein [Novosphingobium sp.]
MKDCTAWGGAIGRRELLRAGALTGFGLAIAQHRAFAQPPAIPAARGDIMPNVRALVERSVGPGRFPGIVASLGVPGREAQFVAMGRDGFTDLDEMTPDSLFRIYSMTKPVTGMATMMLIDEGKLGLDQPLSDILPKYAKMQVQVTPDGSITELRPAARPITIRHLLTHTSGMAYTVVQKGPIKTLMEDKGLIPGRITRMNVPNLLRGQPVRGLDKFADGMAEVPLVYDPGTKWSYSPGLDILGRVIEVVSGKTFDGFLRERLFDPLGMTSTFFRVPENEKGRLVSNFAVVAEALVPIDEGENSIFLEAPASPFGGSGLVCSPRDYDRFLRMLANYGTLHGTRVMSERAVRIGTSNLLPAGVDKSAMQGAGGEFGAGGRVGMGGEAGIYGWGGAAGTLGMVDMRNGLTSSLFVQFMPPDALPLLSEFQTALKADVTALPERRR